MYHGEPSKACLDWLAHMFAGQRHYHDAGYRPQHHKAHGIQHQGKHMRLQLEAAWGRAAAAEAAAQKVVCGPLPPPVALKRHVCLLICCLSCLSAGEAAGAGGCQPAGGCALLPFQRPWVGGRMWVLIELPPRPLTMPAAAACGAAHAIECQQQGSLGVAACSSRRAAAAHLCMLRCLPTAAAPRYQTMGRATAMTRPSAQQTCEPRPAPSCVLRCLLLLPSHAAARKRSSRGQNQPRFSTGSRTLSAAYP